jgi:starch synthase
VALKILAVSSEAFPLAKTGGLGDAVSGLCHAVHSGGAQVTLMLPAYRDIARHVDNVHAVAHLEGLAGGTVTLLAGHSPDLDLPVLLVQNDALYDREDLYVDAQGAEYPDNAIRFATLSQAAAYVARGIGGVPRPDIVHVHDWHSSLVPLYLRQLHVEDVKTMLTLHNVAFQGVFPIVLAPALDIEERFCNENGVEFWRQLSFLKAGIEYADVISVVSRTYAREILTPKFGCGLEGVLAARSRDLVPIPNGIDVDVWNPRDDAYLPGRSFSPERMMNKAVCKHELQCKFGLKRNSKATVLGMGSRMTTQKMADVAAVALPAALDAHPLLQVCIIGRGDRTLEAALAELGRRYPGRCAVHIGFNEQLAHLLHAGSDMLLHGSRFEPFGLTPLYAMRYGTIPIGSKVGGMSDTIVDPDRRGDMDAMRFATGILFAGEAPSDMSAAIDRAMALRDAPDIWRAMQRNAMRTDFSWSQAAPLYMRAYQALRPDRAPDRVPQPVRHQDAITPINAPATQTPIRVRDRLRADALRPPREASAS